MQVLNKESVVFCDVDDTLIMTSEESPKNPAVQVIVVDPLTEVQLRFRKNFPMIRLLEEEHRRGSTIIVWSRGGWEWAEAVIKALGLENKVQLVMSKPMVYFDDRPIEEWLPYRVYLGPDTQYK